jgi:hypothetical protein
MSRGLFERVASRVGFWHFYRQARGERRETPWFFSVHVAILAMKLI